MWRLWTGDTAVEGNEYLRQEVRDYFCRLYHEITRMETQTRWNQLQGFGRVKYACLGKRIHRK